MASNTTKKQAEAKPADDKPKRKNLTPAERIAKAEAELAEIRRKAEEAANKKSAVLVEQRNKLVAKRAELEAKIDGLTRELDELGYVEPASVADVEATSEG